VGGVVVARGKYYLYNAHPVNSTSPDYGFIKVATADAPEGPWTKWPDPVLAPGAKGTFDEGGFSESEVEYSSGVFHLFYDGASYHKEGGRRTAIGYAYSFDGFHFSKYAGNPVAATQFPGGINVWESKELPKGARMMGETHALIEAPFVYLYSTIRPHEANPIGVQVLATRTPFQLQMPVLMLPTLAAGSSSGLEDCPPISLSNVTRVALTAEYASAQSSKGGIRVHVQSSYDGLNYDTADLQTFDVEPAGGQVARRTARLEIPVRFIKVRVENLDRSQAASNVKVTATLGS
jgi:hypothetical protein